MTLFGIPLYPLFYVWLSVYLVMMFAVVGAEVAARRQRGQAVLDRELAVLFVGAAVLLLLAWPVFVVIGVLHVRRQAKRARLFSPSPLAADPRPIGERQWAEDRDPSALCHRAAGLLPHRVRVQFAAACLTMNGTPPEPECGRAIKLALDGLDGEVTAEALHDARDALSRRITADTPPEDAIDAPTDDEAAALVRLRACEDLLRGDAASAAYRLAEIDPARRDEVRAAQLALLREIAGNPFLADAPGDYPPEVVGLAQACYDGDSALNGILADALEDHGRPDDAAHLRTGTHGKGCHVVERVLGLRSETGTESEVGA